MKLTELTTEELTKLNKQWKTFQRKWFHSAPVITGEEMAKAKKVFFEKHNITE
jgi:hypothetical protein